MYRSGGTHLGGVYAEDLVCGTAPSPQLSVSSGGEHVCLSTTERHYRILEAFNALRLVAGLQIPCTDALRLWHTSFGRIESVEQWRKGKSNYKAWPTRDGLRACSDSQRLALMSIPCPSSPCLFSPKAHTSPSSVTNSVKCKPHTTLCTPMCLGDCALCCINWLVTRFSLLLCLN